MYLARPQSFNPHPASLPGDARESWHLVAGANRFNPHPASLPGDARALSSRSCTSMRFNPHPASLPGDAPKKTEKVCQFIVSIRTRHRCRVMQAPTG